MVTVTNTAGCTRTASKVVTVNSCKFEGENGEVGLETLSAAPNPTGGETTVSFTITTTEQVKLSVFAADGKEVAVLFDGLANGGKAYNLRFDMHDLPAGAYFAVLKKPDGSSSQLQLLLSR